MISYIKLSRNRIFEKLFNKLDFKFNLFASQIIKVPKTKKNAFPSIREAKSCLDWRRNKIWTRGNTIRRKTSHMAEAAWRKRGYIPHGRGCMKKEREYLTRQSCMKKGREYPTRQSCMKKEREYPHGRGCIKKEREYPTRQRLYKEREWISHTTEAAWRRRGNIPYGRGCMKKEREYPTRERLHEEGEGISHTAEAAREKRENISHGDASPYGGNISHEGEGVSHMEIEKQPPSLRLNPI